jgi:hypothetical protein
MAQNYFILFLLSFISISTWGQSTYIPMDRSAYHAIDRYVVLGKDSSEERWHTATKPYLRSEVANHFQSLDTSIDQRAAFNRRYQLANHFEFDTSSISDSKKPFLNHFYTEKAALYSHQDKDFFVSVNPVIDVGLGREFTQDENLFLNTRGAEIRGMIDEKIGFYSFLTDNQLVAPNYVDSFSNHNIAVPGENYWKRFNKTGYDFFTARGYLTFSATKHVQVMAGHDKHFYGDGHRSMILSDFGGNYTFAKLSTKIWKLQYTNLYAKLNADVRTTGVAPIDGDYPDKYLVLHHLSINATKWLRLGLFESIITMGQDTTQGKFDVRYANPIIFYRAIEQNIGSFDNALLGLDFTAYPIKKTQLYGQFILDEFLLSEVTGGNGWWANKFGYQLGGKYFNAFGISNLDLQLEHNYAKPYTYSHTRKLTSYSHYNQPLAHPLGANFSEYVGIARYQPLNRLKLTGKAIYMQKGKDVTDTINWGGDIFKPNATREQSFGNATLQGGLSKTMLLSLNVQYMVAHNMFFDVDLLLRDEQSELPGRSYKTAFVQAGFRWNVGRRVREF